MKRDFWSPRKRKILLCLMAGVALGLTRSPRAYFRILGSLPKEFRNIDRQYLYKTLHEFGVGNLVSIKDLSDGRCTITLTEKGKKRALTYSLEEMEIPRPKIWDGRWRLVLFDIPETKRQSREALQKKLRNLGFYCLQKSVYLFPYPCGDEVTFVVNFFDLNHYVHTVEAVSLTNDLGPKRHFGLS